MTWSDGLDRRLGGAGATTPGAAAPGVSGAVSGARAQPATTNTAANVASAPGMVRFKLNMRTFLRGVPGKERNRRTTDSVRSPVRFALSPPDGAMAGGTTWPGGRRYAWTGIARDTARRRREPVALGHAP